MAPSTIDLEIRRLEQQEKGRLSDLRVLLSGSPQEGRAALESLLDGPLVVTPIQDHDGERSVGRFQLVGRTVLGGLPRPYGRGPWTTVGVPKGIRTPVSGVKSRGPGPLDDGD